MSIFGTGFAQAGFSYDPNLSPFNQAFSAAVLAVSLRNGFGTGGGTGGGTGSLIGISGTATGAGTAAVSISGVPISGTGGTFTLAISTFAGTNPGVVPSSVGGVVNFLRADGAFAQPPGTAAGANPTALVSLAGTNGVALTFMRSDGAPPLSTTITPAWSGVHNFQGTGAQIILGTSTGYAWGTGTEYPILQFAGVGGITGTTTAGLTALGGGLYFNGTNYIYGQAGTGVIATLGTGTFSIQAVNTSGTAGGTATPFTVMSVAGSATQGILTLGIGTSLPWGGGISFGSVLQMGVTGGLFVARAGINVVAGAYYNGTNYQFTGTGGGGTSTAVLFGLTVDGMVQSYSGGVGTYTQQVNFTQNFQLNGTTSPVIQAYGPTKAALVDMTPDTGSFNGTFGALTTTVTSTCVWSRNGNQVMLCIGTGSGTSNAPTFTIGGIPAAITPTRVQRVEVPDFAFINTSVVGAITTDVEMVANTNGTFTFLNGGTATGWGATLFKGVGNAFTVGYILN